MEVHEKEKYLKKVRPNLYRTASGKYYLLVKRGGKQFRRSLKTTDFALAKRSLREFQKKAGQLSHDATDRTLTFDDLATRWLAVKRGELKPSSIARRETALKGLKPFFTGHLIREIGAKQIENWKSTRGPKLSARSWNIETETLKQIFAYAEDDLRIIISNPTKKIARRKERKKDVVIPTATQFRALLTELRDGHRSTGEAANFVEFLAYTGCRQKEAASVTWVDVNFDLASLRVTGGERGTKNHESRVLPLFSPLRRLLLEMRSTDSDTHGGLFSIQDARLQISRACGRIGLPPFAHHTMRHFFCSNAIEAGVDFKTIAEWLGHKDGGVLVAKTYGHLRAEHSHAMAKKITFDAAAEVAIA